MKPPIVIFSSDENDLYKPFVEPVTAAWEGMGFEVMCVSIDESNHYADKSLIPYGNQAQMVRALLPALYPDRTFLVSDVDMLPLNKKYFEGVISLVDSDTKIVNVSADAYPGKLRFPMCYYAGRGSAFYNVTGIKDSEDVSNVMKKWWVNGLGWDTDELCFAAALEESAKLSRIDVSLYTRGWHQGRAIGRIDRDLWLYDREGLENGVYVDSHMLRPFGTYKHHLKPLFASVGVSI